MKRMKSVMAAPHKFSEIPSANIQRSKIDRSSGLKTTFDAGYLVPMFIDEALPGDTFTMKMANFARLATPLHPFMDNLHMDFFWFAVPYRLVWDNWQKFNGEQTDPGDSTDFLIPQILAPSGTGDVVGSLSDYFGLPIFVPDLPYSALFHRSYNLIWAEWFRDENLQDTPVLNRDDGPDDSTDYVLLKRGKRHDYMTSCLPWPQKGPSVQLPLGDTAPVSITSMGDGEPTFLVDGGNHKLASLASNSDTVWDAQITNADNAGWADPKLEGEADLSTATAATISQIREAFQIQRMYERDARGGSRYTEIIKSHFGVSSPDQRLQRPEFLGGGSQNISVSAVPQTAATEAATPQGNLAAYATAGGVRNGFVKSFVEHCLIIGLVSARADLTYQRGLDRMMSRRTRWDFFWPTFAHLGEQAVLNKEIWADGSANDDLVFGYQERYAEYRYKASKITGQFRSQYGQSLDFWHLSQDFATLPVLGDTFIQEDPPIDRVVAVPTEPDFLFDAYFDMQCARPMPVYGVPGLIDHF